MPLHQFDMVCRLSDQSLSVTNRWGDLDMAIVIKAVENAGGTWDVYETVSSWRKGETKTFYATADETSEFRPHVLYDLYVLYANGHGGLSWNRRCIVDVTPDTKPSG